MTKEKTMREKVLELLKDEYDLEPGLIKLMETANEMLFYAQFSGFTGRRHRENLQEIYDTCESLLEEIRGIKKEMEEHDQ